MNGIVLLCEDDAMKKLTEVQSFAFYENVITVSVDGVEVGTVTAFGPSHPRHTAVRSVQFNTVRGECFHGTYFWRSRSPFDEEVDEIARHFERSLTRLKL